MTISWLTHFVKIQKRLAITRSIVKQLNAIVFVFFCLALQAQPQVEEERPPLTRILFVFDGSQSMYGRWESGAKIDVAQRLMGQMLDSLQGIQEEGNFQLALRV